MTVQEAGDLCRKANEICRRLGMRFRPDEEKLERLFSSEEIDRIWQLAELE